MFQAFFLGERAKWQCEISTITIYMKGRGNWGSKKEGGKCGWLYMVERNWSPSSWLSFVLQCWITSAATHYFSPHLLPNKGITCFMKYTVLSHSIFYCFLSPSIKFLKSSPNATLVWKLPFFNIYIYCVLLVSQKLQNCSKGYKETAF